MEEGTIHYLSSLDSILFEPVRTCRVFRQVHFDTGKNAFLAEISPAVDGQRFGRADAIEHVLITSRHEGEDVLDIERFPCFVFICMIDPADANATVFTKDRLTIIGWGELYRTREDAETHQFDPP